MRFITYLQILFLFLMDSFCNSIYSKSRSTHITTINFLIWLRRYVTFHLLFGVEAAIKGFFTNRIVYMASNPLLTSCHHTKLTCFNHMSHRVPYALSQRTSWPYIAPSLELVRVHFLLALQICGTHYHYIFAMQLHINNSRNYFF